MFKGKASTVVSNGVRKSKAAVAKANGRTAALPSIKKTSEDLDLDIEAFINSQEAVDVDSMLSRSGVDKVSKKKNKTKKKGGVVEAVVEEADVVEAGAEADGMDVDLDMDEEDLAELKAYEEIQREQRKAKKALREMARLVGMEDNEGGSESDGDDSEDDMDESDDEPTAKVFRNDKPALLAKLDQIRLDSAPGAVLPWIEFQRITSIEPLELLPTDVDNDLKREMAFYKQALEAAILGYKELRRANVPVHRPDDYYAEMVKSDEHMMRVRQKLVDEANSIAAAEKARKLRDAKKFGKKVQHEKLQEREKSKREELDKVKLLRKKAGSSKNKDGQDDDEFGISVEKEYGETSSGKGGSEAAGVKMGKNGGKSSAAAVNHKRKAKDAKFGFGGKKRLAKQNTRDSTDDISGFSVKKMKSGSSMGQKKGSGVSKKSGQRPGKARRQKSFGNSKR
ncbi:eukaryotic rRNA processing protein EBP2-domain-containing protein [Chytriomyces cf. hyalinus JEL632]|nr:eukaryotic rRNA processing protein EBP2-domain-containing protein [Chytriomyces cf. hyalinus JEL632]